MSKEAGELLDSIIKGIKDIKGKEIVSLDLSHMENNFFDYFIICHGDSNTQVNAISEKIEEIVKQNLKMNVWHKEGYENAKWILLDYTTVVVHIFQKEYRDFYNLEGLWADAYIEHIKDDE